MRRKLILSENCSHNCSECGSECSDRTESQIIKEKLNGKSHVKKVIGVVSGKGGVGKSLVTALLASNMQKNGYQTAVLDADITGPSIPKIFGIKGKAVGNDDGLQPVISTRGTQIMSINLLLDDETDPVIWRGPMIAGVVKQFWTDVIWKNVDYMFVDMPPGTGDVPLTVFQSLSIDGIVVVTSPQELVGMIVAKAVKMAETMNVPVIGIIENMSYFECPTCHDKHQIFGDSHIEELAEKYDITALGKMPISSNIARLCDNGRVEDIEGNWLSSILQTISQ